MKGKYYEMDMKCVRRASDVKLMKSDSLHIGECVTGWCSVVHCGSGRTGIGFFTVLLNWMTDEYIDE